MSVFRAAISASTMILMATTKDGTQVMDIAESIKSRKSLMPSVMNLYALKPNRREIWKYLKPEKYE